MLCSLANCKRKDDELVVCNVTANGAMCLIRTHLNLINQFKSISSKNNCVWITDDNTISNPKHLKTLTLLQISCTCDVLNPRSTIFNHSYHALQIFTTFNKISTMYDYRSFNHHVKYIQRTTNMPSSECVNKLFSHLI